MTNQAAESLRAQEAVNCQTDARAVSTTVQIDETAGQGHAGAGDSLGSPATLSESDAPFAVNDAAAAAGGFAALDVPGADPSDDVRPVLVTSTPAEQAEAAAFFAEAKAGESAAQVARARKRASVLSVMQHVRHPETRCVMLTPEQVDAGVQRLAGAGLSAWAYIWHDRDRLVEVDESTLDVRCCGIKGLHVHMVLRFDADARPTVRTVSDALGIPAGRVRVPNEMKDEVDLEATKGRNAAEKVFWDLCEYLTHETRGGDSLPGVCQPERYYLVDKTQPGKPGKYQYGRGRVVSSFGDGYSQALDEHMATRHKTAASGGKKDQRKAALRRLVYEGMTLEAAAEADLDTYLDDLPRLELIRRRYEERTQVDPTEGLGTTWHKDSVLLLGPKGAGKGVLADALAEHLVAAAGLAGRAWGYVQPPGRNALEGVGLAEVIHHDDLRGTAFPSYDETLRWFDPNRATEAWQRHTRIGATYAPRVIMASSTETVLTLGMTLKAHKADSDALVVNQRMTPGRYPPIDIDEFLRRIGWVLDVSLPPGLNLEAVPRHARLDVVSREVVAVISRLRMDDQRRTEVVATRSGEWAGKISTTHRQELVGVLRGAENIARFVGTSILAESHRDVVADIPDEVWSAWMSTAQATAQALASSGPQVLPGTLVEPVEQADPWEAERALSAREPVWVQRYTG